MVGMETMETMVFMEAIERYLRIELVEHSGCVYTVYR